MIAALGGAHKRVIVDDESKWPSARIAVVTPVAQSTPRAIAQTRSVVLQRRQSRHKSPTAVMAWERAARCDWQRSLSHRFLRRTQPATPASQRPFRMLLEPRCRDQLALNAAGTTAFYFERAP